MEERVVYRKKKITVVQPVPVHIGKPKKVLQPPRKKRKPPPQKVANNLLERLKVHKKASIDLKFVTHPLRKICLEKMILRLDKYLLRHDKIVVSYTEYMDQLTTEIS